MMLYFVPSTSRKSAITSPRACAETEIENPEYAASRVARSRIVRADLRTYDLEKFGPFDVVIAWACCTTRRLSGVSADSARSPRALLRTG
jgi:hypothetical protein